MNIIFLILVILVTTFENVDSLNDTIQTKSIIQQNETQCGKEPVTSITSRTNHTTRAHPTLATKCNSSSDCEDLRMTCSKKKCCQCSHFHFWNNTIGRCKPNLTQLFSWLQKSTSNDLGSFSSSVDFEVKETESGTILIPKWTEFKEEEQMGVTHIYRVLIPMFFGIFVVLSFYIAIILNYF